MPLDRARGGADVVTVSCDGLIVAAGAAGLCGRPGWENAGSWPGARWRRAWCRVAHVVMVWAGVPARSCRACLTRSGSRRTPGSEAQRQLPFLFAGSAMASAGAVGLAATALGADREPAARLAAVRVCDDVEAPAELRVAVVDGTPPI